jgi:Ca-activated chloride channel family protein
MSERAWLPMVALLMLAGCGGSPAPDSAADVAANIDVEAESARSLRVLAGSELKELEPALKAAASSAGIDLRMSYAGTLEMTDRANAGEKFDLLLPANGAYLSLALSKPPLAKEKLFYSRVALGVKASKARELGWDRKTPTWSQIAAAAGAGKFHYAMTNPTSSNTGMSALFAVAASRAGKTDDLTMAEVDRGTLGNFLKGQKLTAGSSGWLADAYLREQATLDGIVNYEAVLLRLNNEATLGDKLVIVYPADGVISADYPLLLLDEAARDKYNRMVTALRAREFQSDAVAHAFLRPSNPDAPLAPGLPQDAVAELSFPNNLDVIDAVLSAYQGELRRPATSIYLLDVSGSMRGERLDALKGSLAYLTGSAGNGASARYARFQSRERVILLPFSQRPRAPMRVEFAANGPHSDELDQIRRFTAGLEVEGGTAIFEALAAGYEIAAQEQARDPQRVISVVLLTDGENRDGMNLAELERRLQGRMPARTFPILFGEASSQELEEVATLSGGRTFDGRKGDLFKVFREIRGYQ